MMNTLATHQHARRMRGAAQRAGGIVTFHRNEAFEGEVPARSGNDPASSGNDLSDVEKHACALMAERGEVRSPEVAAATGLTQRGAQKLLARLVARGLAVAEGAKRNRTYRLKHNAEFR